MNYECRYHDVEFYKCGEVEMHRQFVGVSMGKAKYNARLVYDGRVLVDGPYSSPRSDPEETFSSLVSWAGHVDEAFDWQTGEILIGNAFRQYAQDGSGRLSEAMRRYAKLGGVYKLNGVSDLLYGLCESYDGGNEDRFVLHEIDDMQAPALKEK